MCKERHVGLLNTVYILNQVWNIQQSSSILVNYRFAGQVGGVLYKKTLLCNWGIVFYCYYFAILTCCPSVGVQQIKFSFIYLCLFLINTEWLRVRGTTGFKKMSKKICRIWI